MSQITRLMRAAQEPLLLEPRFGRLLSGVFARKLMGEAFDGAKLHAELGIAAPSSRERPASGNVAVIPVHGVIAQHPQSMGTSTDEIDAMTAAAESNPNVDGILYWFDSPGGTVGGVPETADRIRAAGRIEPTAAVADGMAASAAYWLASQTGHITVLKSGEGVGSVGVYTIHEDITAALEQEGVKVTTISAGKFKLEGSPLVPLSDEAMAEMQAHVDEVYGWFKRDAKSGRAAAGADPVAGLGDGRMLRGKAAIEAGMADAVGTFHDALARLSAQVKRSKPRGSRAAVEQQRVALDMHRN